MQPYDRSTYAQHRSIIVLRCLRSLTAKCSLGWFTYLILWESGLELPTVNPSTKHHWHQWPCLWLLESLMPGEYLIGRVGIIPWLEFQFPKASERLRIVPWTDSGSPLPDALAHHIPWEMTTYRLDPNLGRDCELLSRDRCWTTSNNE